MTNNTITAKLNELDAKLDLYKAKVKRMDAEARAEGLALVAKLVNIRKKTARKLDYYSKTSGIAMEKAGLKLQESLKELSAEVSDVGRRLDSGHRDT